LNLSSCFGWNLSHGRVNLRPKLHPALFHSNRLSFLATVKKKMIVTGGRRFVCMLIGKLSGGISGELLGELLG